MNINLSELEIVEFPYCDKFVYRERLGPFMQNAPVAWDEFWASTSTWFDKSNSKMMLAANLIDDSKEGDERFVYRAGVVLSGQCPDVLPENITAGTISGGRFAKFLLTGSYSQLALAFPAAFERIGTQGLGLRKDFAMEVYLNTPNTVENESDLQTEIYIPIN